MKNTITRDKLVTWFINNEYELYVEMRKSEHSVDLKSPNPFHLESEIFTHTLMVMTWVEANKIIEKLNQNLETVGITLENANKLIEEYRISKVSIAQTK